MLIDRKMQIDLLSLLSAIDAFGIDGKIQLRNNHWNTLEKAIADLKSNLSSDEDLSHGTPASKNGE
jgi:hypothetical protein